MRPRPGGRRRSSARSAAPPPAAPATRTTPATRRGPDRATGAADATTCRLGSAVENSTTTPPSTPASKRAPGRSAWASTDQTRSQRTQDPDAAGCEEFPAGKGDQQADGHQHHGGRERRPGPGRQPGPRPSEGGAGGQAGRGVEADDQAGGAGREQCRSDHVGVGSGGRRRRWNWLGGPRSRVTQKPVPRISVTGTLIQKMARHEATATMAAP